MTLTDLWKDFIVIFSTKGRRKLRELEKIQDKTFRIKTTLNTSRANMDNALITAMEEFGVATENLKELSGKQTQIQDHFLRSVDQGNEDDQQIFMAELQTLEAEIVEAKTTVQYLTDLVENVKDKRKQLDLDITNAERILRVSAARYRAAETMLKANAGNIPTDVFREIEEIKEQSVRLQQRNVAITQVADLDQKRTVKAAIARNNYNALPAAELAAKIKAERLENKG